MLVDDRPDLHVFMLRRNPRSVFGPGAFVFPGGAVDPADSDDDDHQACDRARRRRASARLGLASGRAAGLDRRAPRGLRGGRNPARGARAGTGVRRSPTRSIDARIRLNAGEVRLADVLAEHGLVLDASEVYLFSHWLTPEGAPRRYDTWFLVAPAPKGQEGSHDDAELVHSEWVRPSDALARYAAGDLDLIFPTLRTLRVLERFETAAALLDAVRDANRATDRSAAGRSPTRPANASRSPTTNRRSRFRVGGR